MKATCLSMDEWIEEMWSIYKWNIIEPGELRASHHLQPCGWSWGHYAKWNNPDRGWQILQGITYICLKSQTHRSGVEEWLQEVGEGVVRRQERLVKGYRSSSMIWTRAEDLMQRMVTKNDNIVMNKWNLLRE